MQNFCLNLSNRIAMNNSWKLVPFAVTQTERNWNLVKTKLRRSTKQFSICVVRPSTSTIAEIVTPPRPKRKWRTHRKTRKNPSNQLLIPFRGKQKHFRGTNVWKNIFVNSRNSTHNDRNWLALMPAAATRPLHGENKRKELPLLLQVFKNKQLFGKCRWKMLLLSFTIASVVLLFVTGAVCPRVATPDPPPLRPHTHTSRSAYPSIYQMCVCVWNKQMPGEKFAPKWKTMAIHSVTQCLPFTAMRNNNNSMAVAARHFNICST